MVTCRPPMRTFTMIVRSMTIMMTPPFVVFTAATIAGLRRRDQLTQGDRPNITGPKRVR